MQKKLITVECSDVESERLIKQIENIVNESEYRPHYASRKIYEYGALRIDQVKNEVTYNGAPIKLSRKEFEILSLFATHPNKALPCDFLHNVVWLHPNPECAVAEVVHCVEELKKLLQLPQPDIPYLIVDVETTR